MTPNKIKREKLGEQTKGLLSFSQKRKVCKSQFTLPLSNLFFMYPVRFLSRISAKKKRYAAYVWVQFEGYSQTNNWAHVLT